MIMGLNRSLRLRAWCGVFAALAVGLALVASSAAAPPTVKQKEKQKEAQARSVLAQVQALDVRSGAAVEAWDGAKYELKQIKAAGSAQQGAAPVGAPRLSHRRTACGGAARRPLRVG